ncbi:MAG: hypothetical protein ACYC3S_16850 [Chloroflexota bacterium]
MSEDSVRLDNISLPLDAGVIIRHLGGAGGQVELVNASVERWRAEARPWLRPRVVYREVPVLGIANGTISLGSGHRFESTKVSGLFKGAEYLVVAVGSIGPRLEEEVTRLFAENEYMDAMVLDSIGSVAVEEACQYLRYLVCRHFGDELGLKIGPSLSPGYQYWDIKEQRIIFDIVPAADIEVALTESCLMVPRKSESMVIPVGRALRVTAGEEETPCRFCDRLDCPARMV